MLQAQDNENDDYFQMRGTVQLKGKSCQKMKKMSINTRLILRCLKTKAGKNPVMASLACQFDTPGRKEPQLKNCFHQTCLWTCLWSIFLISH